MPNTQPLVHRRPLSERFSDQSNGRHRTVVLVATLVIAAIVIGVVAIVGFGGEGA